jgi:hypothetical protein
MHSTLFYVQRVHYITAYSFLWRFGQFSFHGLSFYGASKYHPDTAHVVGHQRASYQARRPLPDNTQHLKETQNRAHSQETDIHVLVGYSKSQSHQANGRRSIP